MYVHKYMYVLSIIFHLFHSFFSSFDFFQNLWWRSGSSCTKKDFFQTGCWCFVMIESVYFIVQLILGVIAVHTGEAGAIYGIIRVALGIVVLATFIYALNAHKQCWLIPHIIMQVLFNFFLIAKLLSTTMYY